jgi:hypothetical protein
MLTAQSHQITPVAAGQFEIDGRRSSCVVANVATRLLWSFRNDSFGYNNVRPNRPSTGLRPRRTKLVTQLAAIGFARFVVNGVESLFAAMYHLRLLSITPTGGHHDDDRCQQRRERTGAA